MFWLLMSGVKTIEPDIWAVWSDYFNDWRYPAAIKFDPRKADLFTLSRVKAYNKARHIKCAAAESLAILPIFCVFVQSVVLRISRVCRFACDAILALGDLVELLQASQHGQADPDIVSATVRRMLDQCLKAEWTRYMVPKFHWCIHFEHSLRRWGVALTCFVHERKHKFVKRYAQGVCNLASYTRTVLSEVLSQQLHDVVSPDAFDISCKLNRHIKVANDKLSLFLHSAFGFPDGRYEAFESNSARLSTRGVCTRRDVMLVRDEGRIVAGQVWVFASFDSETIALISFWRFKSFAGCHSVWEMRDQPELVPLHDALCVVTWCETAANAARILVPYEYRVSYQ